MGGCQNYGPFLDPYYNTAPNIEGTQKGTIKNNRKPYTLNPKNHINMKLLRSWQSQTSILTKDRGLIVGRVSNTESPKRPRTKYQQTLCQGHLPRNSDQTANVLEGLGFRPYLAIAKCFKNPKLTLIGTISQSLGRIPKSENPAIISVSPSGSIFLSICSTITITLPTYHCMTLRGTTGRCALDSFRVQASSKHPVPVSYKQLRRWRSGGGCRSGGPS